MAEVSKREPRKAKSRKPAGGERSPADFLAAYLAGAPVNLPECVAPEGFYVYLLGDSRNGQVFYAGKGKGRRYKAHVTEWRTGRGRNNHPKIQRIAEIHRDGGRVIAWCLQDGLTEGAAFTLERKVIQTLGRRSLTNSALGVLVPLERSKAMAAACIADLKPFDQWLAETQRTPFQINLARAIRDELYLVAEHGAFSTATFTADRVEFA